MQSRFLDKLGMTGRAFRMMDGDREWTDTWDEQKEARYRELAGRIDDLSPEELTEVRELLKEYILHTRGGELLPDSAEEIREMRDGGIDGRWKRD